MRKSLLLTGLLMLGLLFVFNSSLYAADKSVNGSETTAENSTFTLQTDPSQIKLNTGGAVSSSPANQKSPSTLWLFIKMIFALAVVAGIAYGVFYLMKKNMKISNDADPFLRKVSQISLSPGKSVQVITLQNKAYLIGVSDENINLIGEVEDEQLVNAMNLYADKTESVSKPKSFAELLEIFMPGSKNEAPVNLYENQDGTEVIKQQRQRLNSEE